MARPFDPAIFDSEIFDTGQFQQRRTHGDYRDNKYVLSRPGGKNPSR